MQTFMSASVLWPVLLSPTFVTHWAQWLPAGPSLEERAAFHFSIKIPGESLIGAA